MLVELDIFSGLPNPHWRLSDKDAIEFERLLQTLPARKKGELNQEGLGYRGFILSGEEREQQMPEEIIVYNGSVTVKHKEKRKHYSDINRKLEGWLLRTGRENIDKELFEELLLKVTE